MKNSKLLQVIEHLDKRELRELKPFLRSPFFNQREEVAQLFDYIVDCLYLLDIEPSKTGAHRYLKRPEPFEPQQIRYLMSWLLQLIEKYLSLSAFLEDDVGQKIALSRVYRSKGLQKHFEQNYQKLLNQQQQQPFRHAEFYESQYRTELERYQFRAAQQRFVEQNLQVISDNIDLAYISRKLRQTCLSISHQTVYNTAYQFGLLEEVLQYVEKNNLLPIPAVGIYYHCFLALRTTEEAHFNAFKKGILDHEALFPAEELRDLYLLALNYCIRRLNDGLQHYAGEGLDLYKAGLANGVLLSDNRHLSRFTYRNIVAMALKVGDLEWVATFIRDYKSFLKSEFRESMYSFSLARLAYQKKDYGQVLELLQRSEYSDLLLNLAAKTLMLKTFYELREYDLLDAHLQAMKAFIRRKDLIGYHKINYNNIIRFTQKLLNLNFNAPSEKAVLMRQIQAEEHLTEREWLLEQLE
ncbi:MAG TPA: hypothetical protein PKA00_10970 [Saprospiraceae bacterium]|nr:hypothetical protein [Saprospiraceae bacterium]HMQ83424.1 hypothetical protein [Saprospiraceae bacterium]